MVFLPIKKEHFDRIRSGEKKTEFRSRSKYYENRLRKAPKAIKFRNGYQPTSPVIYAELISVGTKKINGAEYFALELGKIQEEPFF